MGQVLESISRTASKVMASTALTLASGLYEKRYRLRSKSSRVSLRMRWVWLLKVGSMVSGVYPTGMSEGRRKSVTDAQLLSRKMDRDGGTRRRTGRFLYMELLVSMRRGRDAGLVSRSLLAVTARLMAEEAGEVLGEAREGDWSPGGLDAANELGGQEEAEIGRTIGLTTVVATGSGGGSIWEIRVRIRCHGFGGCGGRLDVSGGGGGAARDDDGVDDGVGGRRRCLLRRRWRNGRCDTTGDGGMMVDEWSAVVA